MAVTRSTAGERGRRTAPAELRVLSGRSRELTLLLLASVLVLSALILTTQARLSRMGDQPQTALNLSVVDRREQLLPYLGAIASPLERQYVASKIFENVRDRSGSVLNVGSIGRIRVPVREVMHTRGLNELQGRARAILQADAAAESLSLLTAGQVAHLKPLFVV
ncbi:MAG TPA: hypothetical protein VMZ52_00125, partial [Bryobacteraceae bacterium]|nr:hypothetical protein [Bryobacteraceae bacterium]